MNAAAEMPKYRSHKVVHALRIAAVHGREISFVEAGYEPKTVDTVMFSRYIPIAGDYYVVYADGYKSFSPKQAFEDGYSKSSSESPEHSMGCTDATTITVSKKSGGQIVVNSGTGKFQSTGPYTMSAGEELVIRYNAKQDQPEILIRK